MKFYENVTCQDIVFLTTHLLTFLACSVLVITTEGTEYADLDNSCKPANPNDKIDVGSVRKLYLITYSQADVGCFPPRQPFEEAVLYSFYDRPDKIMHWSCCMEEHPASGESYF